MFNVDVRDVVSRETEGITHSACTLAVWHMGEVAAVATLRQGNMMMTLSFTRWLTPVDTVSLCTRRAGLSRLQVKVEWSLVLNVM